MKKMEELKATMKIQKMVVKKPPYNEKTGKVIWGFPKEK